MADARRSGSYAPTSGRISVAQRRRSMADTLRTRIYTERKACGWPVRKMAEVLRSLADDLGRLPSVSSLTRMIRGWEAGKHVPSEMYRLLYCRAFTMTEDELFGRLNTPPTQQLWDEIGSNGTIAEVDESGSERTGPVSLIISISLPYIPGRVVIEVSEPSLHDLSDHEEFQEETITGYLRLLPARGGRFRP